MHIFINYQLLENVPNLSALLPTTLLKMMKQEFKPKK